MVQSATITAGDSCVVEGIPTRADFVRAEWQRRERRRIDADKPVSMRLKSISCRDINRRAAAVLYGILPSGEKCHVVASYTPFFEVCGREGEDPKDTRRRFEDLMAQQGHAKTIRAATHVDLFRARPLMGGDVQEDPDGVVRYHFASIKEMGLAIEAAKAMISASKTAGKLGDAGPVNPRRDDPDEEFDDSHMPAAARNTKGVSPAVASGKQPPVAAPKESLSLSMNSKSQQDRMLMYLYALRPGEWVTVRDYRSEPDACESCEVKQARWEKCETRGCAGRGACGKCSRAGYTWKFADCDCSTLTKLARAAFVDFNHRKGGTLLVTRILPKKKYPYFAERAHENPQRSNVRVFRDEDWPALDSDARDTTPEFDLVYDIETYADPEQCERNGKPPMGDDPDSRLMMVSMLLYQRGEKVPVASVMISDTKLQTFSKFRKELQARTESEHEHERELAAQTLAHIADAFPGGWDVVNVPYRDTEGMLRAFAGVFRAFDPDTIIDFNGHDYDMPFIKAKADAHLFENDRTEFYSAMNTFACGWGTSDWGIWSKFPAKIDSVENVTNKYFKFDSTVAIDALMQLHRDYPLGVPDPGKPGNNTKKLGAFLQYFKLSPKIEHSFQEMWRAYEKKDKAGLSWSAWYCMWDSAGTYRVCNETGIIAAREPFALEGFCSLDAAYHRGDGMRVEGAVFAETTLRGYTFCYDVKSAHSPKIRGAWVKPPRPGFPTGHAGSLASPEVGRTLVPKKPAKKVAGRRLKQRRARRRRSTSDGASSDYGSDSGESEESEESDGDSDAEADLAASEPSDPVIPAYLEETATDEGYDDTCMDADPSDGVPLADYDFSSQYPNTFLAGNRSYETVSEDERAVKRACVRMGRQWRVIDCEFLDNAWERVPVWSIHHDEDDSQWGILPTVTQRWLRRRARMKSVDLKSMGKVLGQLKAGGDLINMAAVDANLAKIDPHWGLAPDSYTEEEKRAPEFAAKVGRKLDSCDRQQNAVKKLANTAYGKAAMSENNRLLCPHLGGATTAEARYSIHVCADMASEDRTTARAHMNKFASGEYKITPALAKFERLNRKLLARERARRCHDNTHDYTDTDSVYVGLRRAGVTAFVRSMVGLSGDDLKLAMTALRDYAYPYALKLADDMNARLLEHYGNTAMNVKLEGLHMRRLFIRSKCYFSLKIKSPEEDPTPSWTTDALDFAKFKRVYNMCGVSVKKKDTPPVVTQYTMWLVNEVFALRSFGVNPDFEDLTRRVLKAFAGKAELYEGAPKLSTADFVSSAQYKPDNQNTTVQTFVRRVRELEAGFVEKGEPVPEWATPPRPGVRFKFVVCGREKNLLLSGRVQRLSVGERMYSIEHYEHSQSTGRPLVLDMQYYADKKIAPMLGEILSHLERFSKHGDLPAEPTDDQLSKATSESVKGASEWVINLLAEEMGIRQLDHYAAKREWKLLQTQMAPMGSASDSVLAGRVQELGGVTAEDAAFAGECPPDHYRKLILSAERRAAERKFPQSKAALARCLRNWSEAPAKVYHAIGANTLLRQHDGKPRKPGELALAEITMHRLQASLDRARAQLVALNEESYAAMCTRTEMCLAQMRNCVTEELQARSAAAERVCARVDRAVDRYASLLRLRERYLWTLRALRSLTVDE